MKCGSRAAGGHPGSSSTVDSWASAVMTKGLPGWELPLRSQLGAGGEGNALPTRGFFNSE